MNYKDIIILLISIISIWALLYYFKKDNLKNDIESLFDSIISLIKSIVGYSRENFQDSKEKHNLSDFQININKNLFVGFDSKINSNTQRELLMKGSQGDFRDKLNDVDFKKGNIFINGASNESDTKYVGQICLGRDGDDTVCLDQNNIQNFDLTQHPIPVFRSGDKQVYYNNDQKVVGHNKLCFRDLSVGDKDADDAFTCINDKHFDMINGSHAIRFNYDDGTDIGNSGTNYIKPYSVEYGKRNSFSNVIVSPFHMISTEYDRIRDNIPSIGTCYGAGGRTTHFISNDSSKGDQYYLIPEPQDGDSYSHIHRHTDE